jgi:hypothetical protein
MRWHELKITTIGDLPQKIQRLIYVLSIIITSVIILYLVFGAGIANIPGLIFAGLILWGFIMWTLGGLYLLFSGHDILSGFYHLFMLAFAVGVIYIVIRIIY